MGFSAQEGNILPAGRFIAASAECLYFQLRLTRATSEALFGKKKNLFLAGYLLMEDLHASSAIPAAEICPFLSALVTLVLFSGDWFRLSV